MQMQKIKRGTIGQGKSSAMSGQDPRHPMTFHYNNLQRVIPPEQAVESFYRPMTASHRMCLKHCNEEQTKKTDWASVKCT